MLFFNTQKQCVMRNIIISNSAEHANILIGIAQAGLFVLSIRNRRGKRIFNSTIVKGEDPAMLQVPTSHIRPDIYSLIIRSAQAVDISKIFLGKSSGNQKSIG